METNMANEMETGVIKESMSQGSLLTIAGVVLFTTVAQTQMKYSLNLYSIPLHKSPIL